MSARPHEYRRSGDAFEEARTDPSMRHFVTAEHLANERTHVSYMTTAISLVSLGITVNRFSIYLIQNHAADADKGPLTVLRDTKQIGVGMVLFGFLLLVLSLHRYQRVDRAIDRLDYQPERLFVEGLTLTSLLAGALGIIWIFLR